MDEAEGPQAHVDGFDAPGSIIEFARVPSNGATDRRAVVLVVDADPSFGLMVEACLDFEGAQVQSVATLADARAALRPGLIGAVIDPELPDGDGLDLLPLVLDRCPGIPVVVCGEATNPDAGANVEWIPKSDLARITEVLGLEPTHYHLPSDRLVHISALDLDPVDDPVESPRLAEPPLDPLP